MFVRWRKEQGEDSKLGFQRGEDSKLGFWRKRQDKEKECKFGKWRVKKGEED